MTQLRLRHMMASFQWYEKSYQRTIDGICDWSSADRCFAYDAFRVQARRLHRAILNYKLRGQEINQFIDKDDNSFLISELLNLKHSFIMNMNVSSFRHHGKPKTMYQTLKNMIIIANCIRNIKNKKVEF